MDRTRFEVLVEESLRDIPARFKRLLANIAVVVEPEPSAEIYRQLGKSPGRGLIMGLYHGVPFPHRGPYYGNTPPDVISIYQLPIETICRSDEEIKNKVREVVIHEIGHYFGLTDDEMERS